jgi:hypothetical protein
MENPTVTDSPILRNDTRRNGMPATRPWLLLLVVFWLFASAVRSEEPATRAIDMRPHWDSQTPLANPHKGWYHHFPDNHPDKYRIAADRDLLDFPGMDHLYLRLAWSYLQPEEDRFAWSVIDQIIDHWVQAGLGIAFRISCRETSTDRIEQQFATPRWVMQAGAQGDFYYRGKRTGPDGPWEPVFDDPVFLDKLERFLQAFAARYDGKPWLRYVDIGSIGDWGEGHTSSGSGLHYGFAQRKLHVDLYRKYFRQTQLVVSDDFVYCIRDLDERRKMHQYILDAGISYRDDSILVDYYVRAYSDTWTVRSPELFRDAAGLTPTVLELQHYGAVRRDGNWLVRPGSSVAQYGAGRSGADYFRGALELLAASYIGYHGDARQWLEENPELTGELLNRCGYWYFLHQVRLPRSCPAGSDQVVHLVWENRGAAKAYQPFRLVLRWQGPETRDVDLASGNQAWLPGEQGATYTEQYSVRLPGDLPAGRYRIKAKLICPRTARDVRLALDQQLLDEAGFYEIGEMQITR